MLNKHTCNNSSAVALFLTSTSKQRVKKFLKLEDNLSGSFNFGVPLVAIRYKAFNGSSSRYGGSPSIISIAIIPNDQISTLAPYSFCFTTSGAYLLIINNIFFIINI